MRQHTVVVSSNVPDERNTSNHFFNVLSQPLDLSQGRWCVGVKKIIYLSAFQNIINESITTHYSTKAYTTLVTSTGRRPPIIPQVESLFRIHQLGFELDDWQLNDVNGGQQDAPGRFTKLRIFYNMRDDAPKISNIKYNITARQAGSGVLPVIVEEYEGGSEQFIREKVLPSDTLGVSVKAEYYKDVMTQIPPGNYHTIQQLLGAIPAIPHVRFNTTSGKVIIDITSQRVKWIHLNNDLNLLLGFVNPHITKSTSATHIPQLSRAHFAFYIYSNLVVNQHIGSTDAPLLEIISIPKLREFGDVVEATVYRPVYREVAAKIISEIEIKLLSERGSVVFDNIGGNAKVMLFLHFINTSRAFITSDNDS